MASRETGKDGERQKERERDETCEGLMQHPSLACVCVRLALIMATLRKIFTNYL